ncbi:MAG: autoinducer-2 kinase [Cetobacterium sp.]|uniref:autoinducer-2 kinase n=1 Tax=Cetobacterium sp. TaxID=2071632 RepID=UPI002FC6972F
MSKYLMTIDAGTGSVRAVIFNLKGDEISCVSREWEHKEDPKYKGSMDFDIELNWNLTCQCINESISKANIKSNEIIAITTTSMREAIVLYDQNLKEIWACANVDSRATDEVRVLKDYNPSLEKEIYDLTGQTFALGSIPRLLWIKKHLPEIYNKTYRISMLNDWIIFKLSNNIVSEASNSCTTGIFNIKTNDWDKDISKKCNLKNDIFPTTLKSSSLAGYVSLEASKITGLDKDIPIFIGGGDAQLGSIGIGLINSNEAGIFGGSFWQYEFNTATPLMDKSYRVRVNSHAIDNIWQYEAIAFFPGLIMRWFRDAFCQSEKEESLKTGEDTYSIISKKAVDVPVGSNGLICTFSNVMNFIDWRHASPTFTNFSFDSNKFNKYTFYKAIMENSCYVTKGHVELIKEVTGIFPSEITFASGASKSPMWCQILSDVLGIKIKVPKIKEATALGGAILTSVAIGEYSTIKEACENMIQFEKVYIPNNENHLIYKDIYSNWLNVYSDQLEIANKNLVNHMWLAPGL